MYLKSNYLRRDCRIPKAQRGVTLIETLASLAVAGVLATMGVPSMNQFKASAAVNAQMAELESAIHRARLVATTRGELVSICALDAESLKLGEPDCVATGKDWSAGWLVFVDRGERGTVGEADQILAIREAPTGAGGLIATTRYLTYRASGELLSIAAHFRAVPQGQPLLDQELPGSKLMCVNKPGNTRVATVGKCAG
ncbi:GspH/FimT family pseudopilin [Ideonella sp. DXS29W]|uniref:Type II secretion system protein H n=1 Tax=Ideonella lacteola TaxID=2984193 RepID=A0ABU9BHH5_9BURK